MISSSKKEKSSSHEHSLLAIDLDHEGLHSQTSLHKKQHQGKREQSLGIHSEESQNLNHFLNDILNNFLTKENVFYLVRKILSSFHNQQL